MFITSCKLTEENNIQSTVFLDHTGCWRKISCSERRCDILSLLPEEMKLGERKNIEFDSILIKNFSAGC